MEHRFRSRTVLLILGVALAAAVIGVRLYQLQIVRADEFKERALRQHQTRVEIPGRRGAILDRHGRELAVSVESSSLYAHPHRFAVDADKVAFAKSLAPLLGASRRSILERLRSDRPFVWLERRLDPATVAEIENVELPDDSRAAIGFRAEPKRFYPFGRLAVHVIGYATIDQVGVEGIEQRFDEVLQGNPSTFLAVRDGRGSMMLELIRSDHKDPEDLLLTIDLVLQHVVERELDRAMKDTGARAASAILIEPASGEILALANRPAADPNRYGEALAAARRNRAVVDLYEPGSTFKIVTAAAVLDRGGVDPGQRFDCERGSTWVAGHRVRDTSPFGTLTFREIVQKSSNIGILKACRTLDPPELHAYLTKFGFGERLGIELPGESPGLLRPVSRWSALSPASIAFGQEIGVTVLQMATAVATLANDGVLVPPRLVFGKRDADGERQPFDRPRPRRVISVRAARTLNDILEGVVEHGTGKLARVPGYRVAGKTGTAQKAMPTGGYSPTDYVASFGGFGPLRAPKLALMVTLDSPDGEQHQGGSVAAPVFGRILSEALNHLRVPPDRDPSGFGRAGRGVPAAPGWSEPPLRAARPRPTAPGQVPDVQGMNVRDAIAALADQGYRTRVRGRGIVVSQSPEPATSLAAGQTCSIRLFSPTRARTASHGGSSP